ncbi:hypothetical protein J437_LFUL001374 [Ladona fulva]|uniref:ZBR-type domain-containing protein n=1 Tax=Ladona fulva TaxID=123851 RepID=A0A8K0JXS7_LADFU|nr:hypothetical protein J437_LFUL001374 [Ladona fulva]
MVENLVPQFIFRRFSLVRSAKLECGFENLITSVTIIFRRSTSASKKLKMEISGHSNEHMSPIRHAAAMELVTPECTSYLSVKAGEDSGYASFTSAEPPSPKEGSVSPDGVRKRLFDLPKSSLTPEVSSVGRSNRILGRYFHGRRCRLLSCSLEENYEGELKPIDNQILLPEFSTPTKSRHVLPSKISPVKPHPYYIRDTPVILGKSLKSTTTIGRRTPPRNNRSAASIVKFPSFDDPSWHRDPFRARNGARYVDFFRCLGEERIMAPAFSLLLSYISDEDLIACSLVSKTWQALIMRDYVANSRRLSAVKKIRRKKENLINASLKGKISGVNTRISNRPPLSSIENCWLMPPSMEILQTPPPKTSPTKFRFELFMKEGLQLEGKEEKRLTPCPRCSLPSRVDSNLNVGVCTRIGCQFRFCTLCHCLEHILPVNRSSNTSSSSPPRYITCPFAETPKTPPSPPQPITPSSKSRTTSVGSKRSKRNLRRLL